MAVVKRLCWLALGLLGGWGGGWVFPMLKLSIWVSVEEDGSENLEFVSPLRRLGTVLLRPFGARFSSPARDDLKHTDDPPEIRRALKGVFRYSSPAGAGHAVFGDFGLTVF